MSLDVWFTRDIINALQAAQDVLEDTLRATCSECLGPEAAAYREGFLAALRAMRRNFGVDEFYREED